MYGYRIGRAKGSGRRTCGAGPSPDTLDVPVPHATTFLDTMRNPLLRTLALLTALAPASTHAQAGRESPGWLVEQFYTRGSFPEIAEYATGEFAHQAREGGTMAAWLPADVRVDSRELLRNDTAAVFATAARNETGAQDWYTFLRHEGGRWKISEVRTLAFPPLHRVLLDTLEAHRRRGILPDSVVPVAERMRLAIASDSALGVYARTHQAALRGLGERFAAEPASVRVLAVEGRGATPAQDALIRDMLDRRLGALVRDAQYRGCVFLKIGGMLDNEVGFVYAPTGCRVPPVTADRFIYVEEAAPGLFVYKTT